MIDLHRLLTKILKGLYPVDITSELRFNQCTSGSYTKCYKIGKLVILSFNINVTTSTSEYDYITGLPVVVNGYLAEGNEMNWACSSSRTNATGTRWSITDEGSLRSDGAPPTGWHNGNVIYVCDDTSWDQ